jgi:DNA-binding transcriptional LysR family regulator
LSFLKYLSSHIRKLEQQYDTVLFERKPHLRLTAAGHHLLAYAKNTIQSERSLMISLRDDRKLARVRLIIGLASLRAKSFIPEILADYREIWPNVVPSFIRASNFNCDSLLRSGRISLYFGMEKFEEHFGERIELLPDKIYFVVSRNLLENVLHEDWKGYLERNAEGLSPNEASRLPIIMPPGDSDLRPALDRFFGQSTLPLNMVTEISGQDVMLELSARGYGASFVSNSVLYKFRSLYGEHVYALPVPGLTGLYNLNITYDKRDGIPQYSIDFVECAKNTVENICRAIDTGFPLN